MRIEQLEQLIKIVEAGSMNEAASQLYMTRSSLSIAMKNLEQELGAPIFERHSKGVRLTAFGVDVYRQACDICNKVSFLQDVSAEQSGMNLNLSSMYCSLANDAFVELYRRHHRDDFTGSIEECMLGEVINQVYTGLSEIGIITLFSDSQAVSMRKIEEKELEFHPIMQRQLCAIIGPENPLYNEERQWVKLEDLKDFPYIVNYASPSDYPWECTLDGRRRKRAEIQISDLGCALKLIEVSDAIMIDTYDKETYASLYAPNKLKFIPMEDSPLGCKLGWIKAKGSLLSVAASEFLEILQEKALEQQENEPMK